MVAVIIEHAATRGTRRYQMTSPVITVPDRRIAPRPSLEEHFGDERGLLSTPPKTRGRGGVPLTESVRSSLDSLGANVMRTALTMLGIIIGVGAVVALLAIGNGVVATAIEKVERNGTNLVTIQGGNQVSAGVATGNTQNTLTLDDAQALSDPSAVPDAAAISPEVNRGGQMTANGKNTFGQMIGAWPTYPDVHGYSPAQGDWFTDADVASN